MNKASKFILGAFFGGITGALVVILLAPNSGEKTRADLKEKYKNIRTEFMSAITERRRELEAELQELQKS